MSVAPKILIQKMWDVTIVDFQEVRLLEAQQIDAITSKLKEVEAPAEPKREDLGYIG